MEGQSIANNSRSEVDVLVIGAGPTGLGAAKRLNQLVRILMSKSNGAIAACGEPIAPRAVAWQTCGREKGQQRECPVQAAIARIGLFEMTCGGRKLIQA